MTETVETQRTETYALSNTVAWIRVVRYGAIAVAFWSVALQLIAGQFIPPVMFFGVLFAAFVPFLKGERRKLALVVAILAVLALLGNLPGTVDDLSHPNSAPAFILTALVTLAAMVVLVSGVAAFRSWSPDPIRPIAIAAGGLFAMAVIVGLVAASSVDSAVPLASDTQVVAAGVEFDVSQLVVSAGENGFWLDNQDGIRHTFTIEGTDMQLDVPGLSAARADFQLEAGEYNVFCSVPGHEKMTIRLTVEG